MTVGSYRRLLALPTALRRHTVTAARVEEGSLGRYSEFPVQQEERP